MLEAAIQNSVIFHGMSGDEIGDALTALESEEKTYEKGELILIAGERTDRFGLILDGSVTVEPGNPPADPGADGWTKVGADGEATQDDQPGSGNGGSGSHWEQEGESETINT